MRALLVAVFAAAALATTALAAHAQGEIYVVRPGDTVSQLAARWGMSVEAVARANNLTNPNLILVGQRLVIPSGDGAVSPAAPAEPTPLPARDPSLPAPFATVRLTPSQPAQGQTVKLAIGLAEPARLAGTFDSETLRFAGDGQGGQWALLAAGPLATLGQHTVVITATTGSGAVTSLRLPLVVRDGRYPVEDFYLGPKTSQLLAPELVEGEAARLEAMFKTGEPLPLWAGTFMPPDGGSITADFGERRRYNGSDKLSYHEGIDYGLATGTPVRAAAHGVVALAEPLTVRGNAVFIDHGMGVYTGYFHMSELLVSAGEAVRPGQVIGRVGSTGLSTGPHLHWEIRLHGINVSPWEWAEGGFP